MAVVQPPIGKLRQIVKFEENQPTQLGAGKKDNYVEFLTTRCFLRKTSGNRALDLGEALLRSQWQMYCRYQSALDIGIVKSVRCIIDNKIYTIDKYELVDNKKQYFMFILNEAE